MKISMLPLNKRNAAFYFFKIKIHILSYFIVIAFILDITTAYSMRKIAKSKIFISSSKNMALSVFTRGLGGNYSTIKTALDATNAGIIIGGMILQIISKATETVTDLYASRFGIASYSSVLIYVTGVGYSISDNIAKALVNFNDAANVTIGEKSNATGSLQFDFYQN